MCNDAREDGVMFLSPEEFIGDMPEQYRNTISSLREGLKRVESKTEASTIRSMMADCGRSLSATRNYYDMAYNNPTCVSLVQVTDGKEFVYKGNEFEDKIIEAIESGDDVLEAFGL